MRGWSPRFSSTLYGGRLLVSTGLPFSSKRTRAMPSPVAVASTRTLPVIRPGGGGRMRIVRSSEPMAALASARAGAAGAGADATDGISSSRCSRKKRLPPRSSIFRTRV